MNTDRCNEIRELIAHRKTFRIGTRGICIDFYPLAFSNKLWRISINRAFADFICEDIDICEDTDGTILECYPDERRKYCISFDLDKYDVVRRMWQYDN